MGIVNDPFFFFFFFFFFLIFVLPTIIALIDILRNEFKGDNKIIWVLVVLFANIVGAFLYFFIGRSQKIGKSAHVATH